MAGLGDYEKKAKGSRGYKMKPGSPFERNYNIGTPIKKQTGDILPLDAKGNPKSMPKDIDPFSDHEKAIENASNNYNPGGIKGEDWTPSKKQIAIELKKIKEER